VDARGVEAAADWGSLRSAENYVGHGRTENFASPGGATADKPGAYQLPAMLRLNEWGLSGEWTVNKTSAEAWTIGQRIYVAAATGLATSTASTNKLLGLATAVASNPSSTGTVLLTKSPIA
jgi:hypothetical protein